MTGASQSWSHWRHSFMSHKVLVHDNERALAAERRAMHTGRCEAFLWGKHHKGPFYEYDWRNSYPRIARDIQLPVRLSGTVARPTAKDIARLSKRYAILADCTVTTNAPCVPTSHNGRVLWPVGTFDTTLWDNELALLDEAGAHYNVSRAWLYHKAPALKAWAEWILYSLNAPESDMEPWQKLILKHWSRTLIGRFGMRYKSWSHYATAPDSRIYLSELVDSDSGTHSELMQIGTEVFTSGQEQDIDDGCPQITSYIMAEARTRLWRVMVEIGPENVLYVDTDSLLVNVAGHNAIQAKGQNGIYDGLRSKARARSVHIYGPRSYVLDARPSVSGLARDAVKVGDGKYSADAWMGAKESIRHGKPSTVSIQSRLFSLSYNSNRRFLNGDQTTLPYELPQYEPVGRKVKAPAKHRKLKGYDYPAVHTLNNSKKERNKATSAA